MEDNRLETIRREFQSIRLRKPPEDSESRLALLRRSRGRGYLNEARYVIGGLTSSAARDLLISGLERDEEIAKGCVYIAVFALHGYPLGTGAAAQISQGYIKDVRRTLSDADAQLVLDVARFKSVELGAYADAEIDRWARLPSRAWNWSRR